MTMHHPVTVEQAILIDAYNQVQRTQLAVNAAVRTLENASRALADAQGESATATSALVLILQSIQVPTDEAPEVTR